MKYCASSYIFDSSRLLITRSLMRKTAHYKTLQAVIERGLDAKTVERRGEVF
jgi:hypothetical protein